MSFKLDDDTNGLFKSLEPTKRELKEGKEDVKWSCAKCHVLKKRVDLKFCSRVRPVLGASGLRSSLTCGVPFPQCRVEMYCSPEVRFWQIVCGQPSSDVFDAVSKSGLVSASPLCSISSLPHLHSGSITR
jgi:hypothetical protein